MSFAQKVKHKVLARKLPLTTLSWRFLLPGQSTGVRLHRFVLLHHHANQPVLLKILAHGLIFARWWLFQAWLSIYRLKKIHAESCTEMFGISSWQQTRQLLAAALAYGIPPIEYYRMRLHQWPSKQWLDFVYDFQALSWHSAFNSQNPEAGAAAADITNKHTFEQRLLNAKVATLRSFLHLDENSLVTQAQLSQLPDKLFCKPTLGNQSKGCFFLQNTDLEQPRITWFKGRTVVTLSSFAQLQRLLGSRDYLIQPIAKNRHDVAELIGTDELATLRVTTAVQLEKVIVTSVFAEIPIAGKRSVYCLMELDPKTGLAIEPTVATVATVARAANSSEHNALLAAIGTTPFPSLADVLELCKKAHRTVLSLATVAWDAAVAEDGALIVEGNVAWGASETQVISNTPLLQSHLADVYLDSLAKQRG